MTERQLTATAYIIEEKRVLLIFHKKLRKWLPPGGHVNTGELPTEAAIREAYEETGLHIALVSQENVWIERWNAHSFERPYMCLLEEIPAHDGTPAHQHIDFIYLARPIEGELKHNDVECEEVRWLTLAEVEAMEDDQEIFVETKQTLRILLDRTLAPENFEYPTQQPH